MRAVSGWRPRHQSPISTHYAAARRPKPPSLKEQALNDFNLLMSELDGAGNYKNCACRIRRALESIKEEPPMTHPLTDEIIEENFTPEYGYIETDSILGVSEINLGFSCNDLRAAYDKAIEHSIKWMQEELSTSYYINPVGYSGYEIDVESVVEDFREEIYATINTSTKEDRQ